MRSEAECPEVVRAARYVNGRIGELRQIVVIDDRPRCPGHVAGVLRDEDTVQSRKIWICVRRGADDAQARNARIRTIEDENGIEQRKVIRVRNARSGLQSMSSAANRDTLGNDQAGAHRAVERDVGGQLDHRSGSGRRAIGS